MTEAELEAIREDLGPLKDVWESPTIQPEQKVVALSDYLRDVESLLSEVERLRGVVGRAKKLHARVGGVTGVWFCQECSIPLYRVRWPCPTVAALEEGE